MCYNRPKNREDDTAPRYRVTLTEEERKLLEAISTKGRRAARTDVVK